MENMTLIFIWFDYSKWGFVRHNTVAEEIYVSFVLFSIRIEIAVIMIDLIDSWIKRAFDCVWVAQQITHLIAGQVFSYIGPCFSFFVQGPRDFTSSLLRSIRNLLRKEDFDFSFWGMEMFCVAFLASAADLATFLTSSLTSAFSVSRRLTLSSSPPTF